MAELLRLAPSLAAPPSLAAGPGQAVALAQAANHFAQGNEYRVIADPAGYAAAYHARLATEDPAAPWQEGVIRLTDYGVPDFAGIAPPSLVGDRLVFFAEDSFLGLPYRVEAAPLTAPPAYVPLALSPLARPAAAPPADPELVREVPPPAPQKPPPAQPKG